MSHSLRQDPHVLADLCQAASDWFVANGRAISAEIVEKDFWVTETLRALATPHAHPPADPHGVEVHTRAVFKGGTSLSKAYGIIDRFSEDVDIYLVIDPLPGTARTDTMLKTTAAMVGQVLGVQGTPGPFPRKATKRDFVYEYPTAATVSGLLRPGIRLELVRMGTPTPNHPHRIGSMVAEFAAATGATTAREFAELEPFRMDVLAPERTLVDKLSILHAVGSRIEQGTGYELRSQARHYYDVHQLLTSASVLQTLAATPHLVADYAVVAAEDSADARRPAVPRPALGYAASPAFTDHDVLAHARSEYNRETAALCFTAVPDFDTVIDTIAQHANLL